MPRIEWPGWPDEAHYVYAVRSIVLFIVNRFNLHRILQISNIISKSSYMHSQLNVRAMIRLES